MKRFEWIVLMIAAVVLVACGGGNVAPQSAPSDQGNAAVPNQPGDGSAFAPGASGVPGGVGTLDPTTAAAFQDTNRLAIGILYLQTSAQPVTKDQAVTLLPLWQALQTTRQPDQTADTQAMSDTVAKIRAGLTADQLTLIDNMTDDEMAATLQQAGLNMGMVGGGPGGPGGRPPQDGNGAPNGGPPQGTPGVGQGQPPNPGTNGTMMPPDNGTRQPRGGGGNPIIEAVIKMLQTLSNG